MFGRYWALGSDGSMLMYVRLRLAAVPKLGVEAASSVIATARIVWICFRGDPAVSTFRGPFDLGLNGLRLTAIDASVRYTPYLRPLCKPSDIPHTTLSLHLSLERTVAHRVLPLPRRAIPPFVWLRFRLQTVPDGGLIMGQQRAPRCEAGNHLIRCRHCYPSLIPRNSFESCNYAVPISKPWRALPLSSCAMPCIAP